MIITGMRCHSSLLHGCKLKLPHSRSMAAAGAELLGPVTCTLKREGAAGLAREAAATGAACGASTLYSLVGEPPADASAVVDALAWDEPAMTSLGDVRTCGRLTSLGSMACMASCVRLFVLGLLEPAAVLAMLPPSV
jgi:hypothetical protein